MGKFARVKLCANCLHSEDSANILRPEHDQENETGIMMHIHLYKPEVTEMKPQRYVHCHDLNVLSRLEDTCQQWKSRRAR